MFNLLNEGISDVGKLDKRWLWENDIYIFVFNGKMRRRLEFDGRVLCFVSGEVVIFEGFIFICRIVCIFFG